MRSLALVLLLAAPAAAEPSIGLVDAEVSAGVAGGGGQGEMSVGRSPIYLGVHGAHAINAAPWTWLRAGAFLELGDRAAIGVDVGPRIALGKARAGVAAVAILAPYRLYGAEAQLGLRVGAGHAAFIPGVAVQAFAGGNDLPDDHVAVQLLFSVGIELDAW